MELLLGAAVYALLVMKLWTAARNDHELAKQGIVPPRQQARYGDAAAGKVAKYGFTDFLKDAWNDYWPRRTEALIAARDAKAANPGRKVSWRERLAAAKTKVTGWGEKLVTPVGEKKPAVDEPVVPAQRADPDVTPALAVDAGDVPPGTVRFTDDGAEEWTGTAWKPVAEPVEDEAIRARQWQTLGTALDQLAGQRTAPTDPNTSTAGGTMSAPTGEAVNYETTVAELDKLIDEQQKHLDACIAAEAAIASAAGHIGDMQDSYRTSSDAARSTHDHLAAMNLDGVTLSHTGTTADAMPAGAVDTYYDQLEVMQEMAKERRDAADAALQSTVEAKKTIVEKYGDAYTVVAGELSGDSRFLDGGGASGAGGGSAHPGHFGREMRNAQIGDLSGAVRSESQYLFGLDESGNPRHPQSR